jgi:primosomal protein N' (replication factor Y)
MRVAEVAFPLPLHRTFDYLVPDALAATVAPGSRVRAPFGPRRLTGFVVGLKDAGDGRALKSLDEAEPPLWGPDLVEMARWLSEKYCASLGECLSALLPNYLKAVRGWEPLAEPAPPASQEPRFELNDEQSKAYERLASLLSERRHAAALLLGVPASGKTEIYLRLLEAVAREGAQALFLVPEIALTHPFLEEFAARLPVPLVSWHSKASVAAKKRAWLHLAGGRPAVVVGARSAALLPLPRLRLAVVDEEQDESYKQDGVNPQYHAREVAIERARRAGCLAILGSATPSLESYQKASAGEWDLLRLSRGVQQKARPSVTILDRRKSPTSLLLPELSAELKKALDEKEQTILVVNRRGFSPLTLCRHCGWLARCKACGIAMVHHQGEGGGSLRCHHCEAKMAVPAACPDCKKPIAHSGAGTQRAESAARELLPDARVLRFDADTMKANKESESLYRRFKKLEADVMVGTRLVSKGYHFPEVTLVGIVDADAMLDFPDFRGAEKTYQLLVQAAGRAGRAQKPGRVLLQTFHPDHYAIEAAAKGDYDAFAKRELEFRKELGYPPFGTLFRVVVSAADEAKAADAAETLTVELRKKLASNMTEVLGPGPAFHKQLRGKYRFHLLIKARGASASMCRQALREIKAPSGSTAKVTVDPHDLL